MKTYKVKMIIFGKGYSVKVKADDEMEAYSKARDKVLNNIRYVSAERYLENTDLSNDPDVQHLMKMMGMV